MTSTQDISFQTSAGVSYKFPVEVGLTGQSISLGQSNQLIWSGNTSVLSEPFIIAHRGGPYINPENSMEAYDYCIQNEFYNIEPDVRILRDNVLGVMHDSTVDRTTTSTGNVNSFLSLEFENISMEAGSSSLESYYLPSTANPPLLSDMFQKYGRNCFYFPEAKSAVATRIARMAEHYNVRDLTVIQSFSLGDLEDMLLEYPGQLTCYLVGSGFPNPTIAEAAALGIQYLSFSKGSGAAASVPIVNEILAQGMKPIVYTIYTQQEWDEFKAIGCVGAFSNDPLYTGNTHTILTKDPYSSGRWYPGIYRTRGDGKIAITDGRLTLNTSENPFDTDCILQGWGCPLPNPTGTYTITFDYSVRVQNPVPSTAYWISIAFCCTNEYFSDGTSPDGTNCYHLLLRASTTNMQLYTSIDGSATSVETNSDGSNIITGGSVDPLNPDNRTSTVTVTVNPTTVTISANGNLITYNDASIRGPFFFLNRRSGTTPWGVQFFNINIT